MNRHYWIALYILLTILLFWIYLPPQTYLRLVEALFNERLRPSVAYLELLPLPYIASLGISSMSVALIYGWNQLMKRMGREGAIINNRLLRQIWIGVLILSAAPVIVATIILDYGEFAPEFHSMLFAVYYLSLIALAIVLNYVSTPSAHEVLERQTDTHHQRPE